MIVFPKTSSWLIVCCLYFLVLICNATIYDTRFKGVKWDDSNWRITTTKLIQGIYQARASIANGYIGINVAALGPFFEVDKEVNGDDINGWPLFQRRQTFATVSGFYDVQPKTNETNYVWLDVLGGESVISGIPHWGGLVVEWEGQVLNASTDASEITGYTSTLDIGAGLLSWSYTWTPASGGAALDIEYSLFAHRLYVNQAVTQLKITSTRNTKVIVSDVLDGDCAVRTHFVDNAFESDTPTIWTAVQPREIPYVTAYIYSTMNGDDSVDMSTRRMMKDKNVIGGNASSIGQSVDVNLIAGRTATLQKFVGIASTDAFESPQSVAQKASATAAKMGYVKLLQSHMKEWSSIMTPDSVDDFHLPDGSLPNDPNIVEQQLLAVSNPFALLQNTISANAIAAADNNQKMAVNSIAVGGLTSDSYAGLIFWDAEVWMAPGLVVAFPQAAQQIANYRRDKYKQAKENIKEAYTSSQAQTHFSKDAAIFPWTSGRFGNCTGTGPCFDYEYHINGDIGLELQNYYFVTGDNQTFHDEYFPIYNSVAAVYSNLMYLNKTTGTYMLSNATDPDEYANMINNPGYTMVLIKTHLEMANKFRKQFGLQPNEFWAQQVKDIEIPVDKAADIILEYSGMNGSIIVKQADVVLIDDFLHYPNPYTLSDFQFYAGRQTLNGPGMTFGVFSDIAAQASPSGCSSFTYDLYGSQPYVREPWFQFSEQLIDDFTLNGGTHPAFPFLTGMGGANRVAMFGYLGLHLEQDTLNINPSLPPQIPNLRYRTFYWQGHAFSATANKTHTTIRRLPSSRGLDTANPTYASSAVPVTVGHNKQVHNLETELTFPNRRPDLSLTVAGNLAQCKPIAHSSQAFEPGQFPLAAVDGSISSKWQPNHAGKPATLTVELGEEGIQPITGFKFDWAQSPPVSYTVSFSNSTSNKHHPEGKHPRKATSNDKVKISIPYDPNTAALIRPYMSNTTNVTLAEPVWGGKYATLTIMGNQAGGTSAGASVAEFAVVGMDAKPVMPRYRRR